MAISLSTMVIVLASILCVAIIWIIRLEMKIRKLLLGKDAQTLEDSILFARTELEKTAHWQKKIEHYLSQVEQRLRKSLHEAKTVRFNPFKGSGEGGNQSFATAFISEEGNGVVISSLYTRDRMSVFAKPIEKRVSTHDLTEEEQEAIALVTQSVNTKK